MAEYKSMSQKKFEELRNKLASSDSNNDKDERENNKFKPVIVDGDGRSEYKIRFLPNIHKNNGEDEPWHHSLAHIFTPKGGSKKTYQLCPHTFDEKNALCPICQHSKMHFNVGNKVSDDIGRSFWRKKRYFINVLVLNDPRKGDDSQQGKVLYWEFGPKVFGIITEAMKKHDLFFWDIESGCDFNVVVKRLAGFMNYDSSDFSRDNSDLNDSQDVPAILEQTWDLEKEVFNPDENGVAQKLKSYDELSGILEGKNVKDSQTRDDSAVDIDRTTRTLDTTTETEEIKVETIDESSVEAEPQVEVSSDGSSIDIDSINFDEDDPF